METFSESYFQTNFGITLNDVVAALNDLNAMAGTDYILGSGSIQIAFYLLEDLDESGFPDIFENIQGSGSWNNSTWGAGG